jgi:N-sulfoglucosamine sulfohydrolase
MVFFGLPSVFDLVPFRRHHRGVTERRNILFITADDMNADTLGCSGGAHPVMPTLDRLAADGVLFRRAHVAVAVCQPSRSAMFTGVWPHRSGAEGFDPIDDEVPVLTDVLKPVGYRIGILGKVDHLAPVERFGWDLVRREEELGMGRDPRAYREAAVRFVEDSKASRRPWLLLANSHDPHRPFHGSDDEEQPRYPPPSHVFAPGDHPVPGFLPDLPDVRREIAEYMSSSRRCDDTVGALLEALDACGEASRTTVLFSSDHGMSFPFVKSNCYLHSTRTPLVVRAPGISVPHVDTSHFVSGIDIFPTLCEIAGVEPPADLDGRSFVDLCRGEPATGRDQIITVYHETWQRERYEMRCIQDAHFGYIWNAWSDGKRRYWSETMTGRTWPSLVQAAESDPVLAERRDFYLYRVPEELYRFDSDPDALENVVDDPECGEELARARRDVLAWMKRSHDPLAPRYEPEVCGGQAAARAARSNDV